jgi:ring-1,2-phenylacetyl-CoA epoxidase subunit PaaC
LWSALQTSEDTELGRIARKSLNETRSHLQHASGWTVRLGDGTDESHKRMQDALDGLWPYTAELFSTSNAEPSADAALGPAWQSLRSGWLTAVRPVLDVATLQMPEQTSFLSHGKEGDHSEHLAPLLAEMQYLQRTFPGRNW